MELLYVTIVPTDFAVVVEERRLHTLLYAPYLMHSTSCFASFSVKQFFFLISNFHRVLNVVRFRLGDSLACVV
jgi:hypothetical protein